MSMLQIDKRGRVAILTLNRPEAMNALSNGPDGAEIAGACDEVTSDPDIRAAILTGAGRAFSAGGDIKAMRRRDGAFGGTPDDIRRSYRDGIHKLVRTFYHFELPLIAAVNGPAIGLGCDVACMADIRIASDRAKFGVTFLKLALIPGDGGAWLLPRIIGHARAAELLYTGDVIDAERALEWGLVSRVVPGEQLMDDAIELAEKMAAQPPQALRLAKQLLRRGATTDFDTIMDLSAASQALMHVTDDHMEGIAAIFEKRPADFKGQ